MIDANKLKSRLEEELSKMSYSERETYFKQLGFSFEEEKINFPVPIKVTTTSKKIKGQGTINLGSQRSKAVTAKRKNSPSQCNAFAFKIKG